MVLAMKNSPANAGNVRDAVFDPWVRKISWRRKWQPTPVFLPRESHGQSSLAGCSPWGYTELAMTEVTEHSTIQLLQRFNEIIHLKNLAQCLAASNTQ